MIFAGQALTVCPGCVRPAPACRAQHVVAPGDTLIGISIQYGVALGVLAAANNIANPDCIYVGQVLCIPN
jgi:LysM repeat protein